MGAPLKLADITTDELIDRVSNGEIPSRIARELGVTKAAVYYHLRDHPNYLSARQVGMMIRLDDAEDGIANSTDQLSLARSRDGFRAVSWRAEREHPDLWGNRYQADMSPNLASVIEHALAVAATGLLDRLRTVSDQQQMTDVAPHMTIPDQSDGTGNT